MNYTLTQEGLAAVSAMRFTEDNQDVIENWCSGSIKGTRLPSHERHLEVYNEVSQEIHVARVGDWLVKDPIRGLTILKDSTFHKLYTVADLDAKFVRLSAAQYSLICCMEEHAEVIQACSKMLRFGPKFVNPITGVVNEDHLAAEMYDADLLNSRVKEHRIVGVVSARAMEEKNARYKKYTDISRNVAGTIE